MEKRTLVTISGQFLLALTILIATFMVTNTLKKIKFGQGTVSVKGCAEKEIQSDYVKWQGMLSSAAPTQIQAYTKLEKDLDILRTYMEEQGIPWNLLMLSPISTSSTFKLNENGHSTNSIESYSLSQDFSISSTDISLVTNVSQNITSLIKEGLSINSSQPQYYYLKIDELKIEMLGEAAKDAKMRAEKLLANNGTQVGTLRSANQGVFQITPAFSSSVSDYGEYDTSSVTKKIRAVVTMEYAIEE